MKNNVIKIAQILGDFGTGGVETLIMNYFSNVPSSFVFDFFVNEKSKNIPFDIITNKGGKVFLMPTIKHIHKYNKKLLTILKNEKYDIIQSNLNSLNFIPLRIAKKAGIKIRISNSLSSTNTKEGLRCFVKTILKKFSKKYASTYFACSDLAGQWLFGKKIISNRNYFKVFNAINEKDFQFNENIRQQLRAKYDLENKIVIGNIGRLETQKNQLFLLKVFKGISYKNKDYHLVIIGDGTLRQKLDKQILMYGLTSSVTILSSKEVGVRTGIKDYYNMFDIFVLPSLYEGLPMVGIEAQINSLPCIFSSQISQELQITNDCQFIDLHRKISDWTNVIININKESRNKLVYVEKYDIASQSKRIANIYYDLLKGDK